jgi:hypothetical protein
LGAFGSQIVLSMIHLEPFSKDRRLRQTFSELRIKHKYVPIDTACFLAWSAYVQLALGNIVHFMFIIKVAYESYTSWIKKAELVPIPLLVEEDHCGILKLPILDGKHTFTNIAVYSTLLGIVGGLGLTLWTSSFLFSSFGTFVTLLTMFHLMEYVTTVMFNRGSLECKVLLM